MYNIKCDACSYIWENRSNHLRKEAVFVMATQMNVTDLKTENNDTPDYEKRLPDAEFEVMLAIWNAVPPVNTAYLMEAVGKGRSWKAPTLISFLVRLEDRGYITSFKKGKERYYEPSSDKSEYIRTASEQFVKQYHGGSFVSMMDSLYKDKKLSEEDIDELLEWLKSKY